MQQRRIGKNGPLVSVMELGCMGISMGYSSRDDAQSIKIIHKAIDLGITLLDTVDMYEGRLIKDIFMPQFAKQSCFKR